MEESKLTMIQRKSIQEAVDRGEPLPPPAPKTKIKEKFGEAQVKKFYHNVYSGYIFFFF